MPHWHQNCKRERETMKTTQSTLSTMSVQELSQLQVDIQAQMVVRAGRGFVFEDADLDLPCPSGGAVLVEDWCTDRRPSRTWYDSIEAAMAALALIAAEHGRQIEDSAVDLTVQGCLPSSAYVE